MKLAQRFYQPFTRMDKTKFDAFSRAGKVAAAIHQQISQAVKPGVNVLDLEKIAAEMINKANMQPAFKGFKGYPAVTCISINDQIVHGIPTDRIIEDGDVVSVDLGVASDGWIVDTARTHIAGQPSQVAKNLVATAEKALSAAIELCCEGQTVGDIGHAIETIVQAAGFHVVEDLTGHGVGQTLQEPPTIPNYGRPGKGQALKNGMVLAIEPIITTVSTQIGIAADGWTIIATDDCLSAHAEDTIIISPDGPIILTR